MMNNRIEINYFENSSRVGIEQLNNNSINLYLPIGVTKNDVENDDDFIYKLINSILPAKKKELELHGNLNNNNIEEWPIYSEMWLVKDYIHHGLYKEIEKKYAVNNGGKINWKKTINQDSIFYNNSVYYPNIVFEKNDNTHTVITELQKYCLNKCAVGKFICKLKEEKFNVKIFINEENINYYINLLNKELSSTFEDHKKQLLNSLINILTYYSSNNITTINSYITYEYHYSWEHMIAYLLEDNEILKKELLPKSEYHLIENGYSSSLIPDTIFSKDDSIFIIDSKYYSKGNVPATSDICKQTEYCRTAEDRLKNNRNIKQIYNSFILPFKGEESNKCKYVGYGNMKGKNSEKYKINVIYLDTLHIINMFYEGNKIQDIEFLKNNACIIDNY